MNDNTDIYGISVDDIIFNLKKLDMLMSMDNYELELCLIGGTACLLTGLISRVTIDYDLLNLDYNPKVRNYLNFLSPYDLVDFEATTIPRSYKNRLCTIFDGDYVKCKILSKEDIVVSKLCRNLEKDFADIDILIKQANMNILLELIQEVYLNIKTRYLRIQENFQLSLKTFEDRYNIHINLYSEGR